MNTLTGTIEVRAVLDDAEPTTYPATVDGFVVRRGDVVLVWRTEHDGLWQVCDGYWRRLAPFTESIAVDVIEGVKFGGEKFGVVPNDADANAAVVVQLWEV